MKNGKTGVLLINLGTPDSPSTNDVRSYLFQFLNDPRVIDIAPLARALLVNLIIVPFRAPKSAKIYQELWTEEGSPLLIYTKSVAEKLQGELGDEFHVDYAMRYKKPSMEVVLGEMKKMNLKKIILLPLFPHYASSSTGSALQKAMEIISKWWVIPEISTVSQYFNHEGYINAFVERGKQYPHEEYDHVLFSYHGLPERQLDKVYEDGLCSDRDCEHEVNDENHFCYKATCYETTRLLAQRLGIPPEKYSVAFQSRLGSDPWVQPFSDKVVEEKAKTGAKKMLVFSPAFTADCLETVIEIGEEYKEIFEEHGGEKLQLVESLNDHPLWVQALKDLVMEKARPDEKRLNSTEFGK
ncbi:ferrochelatase [Flammeovirgaceae bacterium SG7u.111]|nr:ferrochelatase [Flammeovirgaceae bacterium SG7u.132]WPO34523.1 ferrochelatase [Flammeovirgaceae bacterium SG7u.111]